MSFEKVNKRMTMDGFLVRVKKADSVQFKIKWMANRLYLPEYQKLREDLKNNKSWRELENIDIHRVLPSLSYGEDKNLIEEMLLVIRAGNLYLRDTELRFIKKGVVEYYSTVDDVLTLIGILKTESI